MRCNVGKVDGVLRYLLGFGLLVYGIYSGGTVGMVLGLAGIGLLVTAVRRWCPIYQFFGLTTTPKGKISDPR